MKKTIILAMMFMGTIFASAQMTPEAILGSAPATPDWHDVADSLIRREFCQPLGYEATSNAAVDNYFKMLKNAETSSREMIAKMPAPSNKDAQKRNQQIEQQRNDRAAAGQKMKQFMASLTPEQQKMLMSCKNEQESMNAIKKMGKWEEFSALMSGTKTSGSDSPLTKEETEWMYKDLTTENAVASQKIDAALETRNKVIQRYQDTYPAIHEKAHAISAEITDAQFAVVGKGSGDVDALRAQLKDLLMNYYGGILPEYLRAQQTYLQAIKSRMATAKMNDKKDDITRRVNGMGPKSAVERDDYSTALWYLQAAYDLLLGERYEFPEE